MLFKIALALLALMALAAHFLRTLGDFVALGMVLFYGFVGSFALGGLGILIILAARRLARVQDVPLPPAYVVRFHCRYPGSCADPTSYTAERTERVQHATVTCPGEAEVYVRAYWNVVKILSIDRVIGPCHPPRAKRRRSFWS